jgi:chemotaxis protein MotA
VDKSTIGGILLAVGGILAGLLLEGGKIAQIIQPTAAMIVLGGTLGAVMVQFPLSTVVQAFKRLAWVFFDKAEDPKHLVDMLVGFALRARKNGIVSLDAEVPNINDLFLKKALMLAVDGIEPEELRKMMELELDNQAEHSEKIAQVFESAGGFAPTIGIIGAVLGLIQVMQHLSNIDEVGKGIAVAFVATIYGVGSANLLFLPSSGKLKIKGREEQILREMTLEGVISILEGMNPRMLETKLLGYLLDQKQPEPQPA